MAFGDADLDVFTADMGVPVSFTGAPMGLRGLVDVVDALVAEHDGLSGVLGAVRTVRLPHRAAAALTVGSSLTVDGTTYTIRHRGRQFDGAFTRFYLLD